MQAQTGPGEAPCGAWLNLSWPDRDLRHEETQDLTGPGEGWPLSPTQLLRVVEVEVLPHSPGHQDSWVGHNEGGRDEDLA